MRLTLSAAHQRVHGSLPQGSYLFVGPCSHGEDDHNHARRFAEFDLLILRESHGAELAEELASSGVSVQLHRLDPRFESLQALATTLAAQTFPVATAEFNLCWYLLCQVALEDMAEFLCAGHLSIERARAAVRTHLGVYAEYLLERVVNEVEWHLMKLRHTGVMN